ncbi:MAG: hypothetical protein KBC84_07410 [Proteobacteria bacterium]|nr:hypothetical protein [Pseudomonadota bacterium]
MALPAYFGNRVYEEILNDNAWAENGLIKTDPTRAQLVALIDQNPDDLIPVLTHLLRWEERLSHMLPPLRDPDDIRDRILGCDEFKALLRKKDPAKVFAALGQQAVNSAMLLGVAESLGMGSAVILRGALESAAATANCREELKDVLEQITPGVKAEIADEMKMTIAERIMKKGY